MKVLARDDRAASNRFVEFVTRRLPLFCSSGSAKPAAVCIGRVGFNASIEGWSRGVSAIGGNRALVDVDRANACNEPAYAGRVQERSDP